MRYLLALCCLVACGDNLEGIPVEDRINLEAAARCKQQVRCGLFEDEASCVAFVPDRIDVALTAAVNAGVVHFNPVLEKVCLSELAEISCDRTSRSSRVAPKSCQGTLVGTRVASAECRFDSECQTERCLEGICEPFECCQGTCKVARVRGGACDDNGDCFEGEYCGVEHMCTALEAELKPCTNDDACDYGLACVGASSVERGTCRKLPAIGEACPYGRCADIGATCGQNGKCVALGLPGASCSSETECVPSAPCDEALRQCVPIPSLGMSCSGRCAGNAACVNGTCIPPLEDGTPCGGNSDCQSGLCAEGLLSYTCMSAPTCF